jgi:hypothetical protein
MARTAAALAATAAIAIAVTAAVVMLPNIHCLG